MYDEIIIGAGPAGLTAGYELVKNNKKNVLILEKNSKVGGLATTKVFNDYKYDIGPHRFFTKNNEVRKIFMEMLGDDAVRVDRLTRIYYKNKYFNYPLTPVNALFGLGPLNAVQVLISYGFSRFKSYLSLTSINNFEDWVIDRFGKKLYRTFFKNYTEKVWGIECSSIGKDWAAQRIKGLSLSSAIKHAFFPNSKNKPKSLIDMFYYPRLGAGMLWEKFEDFLSDEGVAIKKNLTVVDIKQNKPYITVIVEDGKQNKIEYTCKKLFFSNPLLQFIKIYDDATPSEVTESAANLNYRHHISVHLAIDKKLFKDNWIYIHSPDIKAARIADFTNFSKDMAPENEYTITLEYFCFEDDEMWLKTNNELIEFASKELSNIFNKDFNLVHSAVSRSKNAYPVISSGYEDNITIIKNWMKSINNISAIGRSGMFKYNNQDHAMATAIAAVRRYAGDLSYDPWNVNIDGEYQEMMSPNID